MEENTRYDEFTAIHRQVAYVDLYYYTVPVLNKMALCNTFVLANGSTSLLVH